jgi:excisionase family DNA binding protein
MNTLDLNEAARFLKMHPQTVRRLAKAGVLPGAKPGKLWCFLEADLADYLRSLYGSSRQVSQGSTKEATLWHFSSERSRVTGGCDSRPPTASRYANLLGLPTGAPRKSTKIKRARHSGDSTN